jgi:hypothetical protein
MLFLTATLNAQVEFEQLLKEALYPEVVINDNLFNQDLKMGIQVLDRQIDSIVTSRSSSFKPAKYTIIESRDIGVFEEIDKLELIQRTAFLSTYVKGYSGFGNETFNELWLKSDRDHDKYINALLDSRSRLSNFFTEDAIIADRDKFFLLKYNIKTSVLRKNIGLDHLVYAPRYADENLLENFSKIKDTKTRERFLKFISTSVDNIDIQTFFVTPQAIRISYFYVLDGIIKLGVDIYGTHYLVSIDKAKKAVIKMEEKWVY